MTVLTSALTRGVPLQVSRAAGPRHRPATRPNVMVICVDQGRGDALSAARDGVPFTEAHPVTMPGVLRGHGYQTQAIGKMHVYPERSRCGFEDVRLHDGSEHLHPTNWVVAETLDWLDRRDPTVPFFTYVSFHGPHAPSNPPQWAFDQYFHGPRLTPGVGDWVGDFEEFRVDDHQTVMGRLDPASHHRAMSGYFGNISHIDLQINRLIEGLADFELLDETSIVFVSDHGEMMGDHDMYRKSVGYEGSAHVPMIVRGAPAFFPDAPRGQVVDAVTHLRDVMPTVLAMAGVDCPDSVDGLSLPPYVCGEHPDWRSEIHGEHVHFYQSLQWVTDGRRKYLWASARGVEQFFDLESDPDELHDLTDEADRAEEVDRWRATLIEYLSKREEGFVVDGSLVPGRSVQTEARRIGALATR